MASLPQRDPVERPRRPGHHGHGRAVNTHAQPAKRVLGTTANMTERSASGTNSTAATASLISR